MLKTQKQKRNLGVGVRKQSPEQKAISMATLQAATTKVTASDTISRVLTKIGGGGVREGKTFRRANKQKATARNSLPPSQSGDDY